MGILGLILTTSVGVPERPTVRVDDTAPIHADPWPWFSENGILETFQVLILLVMLARYLYLAMHQTEALRALFACAAMITLGCILREVEFDQDGSLGWADRALRGPGRIIAVVIAIPVGIYAFRVMLREPRALPRLLLGNWWGRSCIAGGFIVVIAGLYDRGVILDLPSHQWEEAFETVGYLLVAASTFIPVRTARATIARPLRQWKTEPEVSRSRDGSETTD